LGWNKYEKQYLDKGVVIFVRVGLGF